jgi:2-iminobutanoate/2-iminopropanoate deaminase
MKTTVVLGAAALLLTAGLARSASSPAKLRAVLTDKAPKPGPYSQGIVAGEFLFVSGMTPTDPQTGNLVGGGIEQATDRVMDNLAAVLATEKLTFADVVKVTVYLAKAEDFAAMNAAYLKRLGDARPARSSVFVSGLPKGAALEMDVVALVHH